MCDSGPILAIIGLVLVLCILNLFVLLIPFKLDGLITIPWYALSEGMETSVCLSVGVWEGWRVSGRWTHRIQPGSGLRRRGFRSTPV